MSKDLLQIQQLISKDFSIVLKTEQDSPDLDALTAWLAHEVQLIMDQDFQQFLNILYRIDISESKAREAFANENPPFRLAELIIEREMQKVRSRKKWSQQNPC